MPRHHKLCFVIADGGHARFVRPAADNALHTFEAVDSTTHESGPPGRHAYTPRTDPQELAKDQFTHAVARRVNEDSAADVFNELVVVAPPHVLSELTGALDVLTKAKLLGSLPKDLVKTPDHELWPHLKEWVRPVQRA